MKHPLALFYEEPDPNRWFPGDRYPRRLIRRLVHGPRRPGGQEIVFLNLRAGLDRLGVPYRVNDYRWARHNPNAPVGIIGKPFVLDRLEWRNPILFGASVMSHPDVDPGLLARRPIQRILVPGEWMRQMCEPRWGDRVRTWPVGIDTDLWQPAEHASPRWDFLLYDKVRWEHDRYERELLGPIRDRLRSAGLSFTEIRYGRYREEDYRALLPQCRALLFLCEHETQGLAYQQALSSGVPILAWNRGGFWQDPEFYPHRVQFRPVSSVPYWDPRCGEFFTGMDTFSAALARFQDQLAAGAYAPRDYILDNLTLEKGAQGYLHHWEETFGAT